IVLFVAVEGIRLREVVELLVDETEVPRVAEVDHVSPDGGLGKTRADLSGHGFREPLLAARVQQLETMDDEVLMAAEIDGRPPGVPTLGAPPSIECGAEQAEDHDLFRAYHWISEFILTDNIR